MNRKRWIVVIGTIGTAAAVTGCDQSVRDYLGQGGPMQTWQKALADAVCQLETQNPSGLNPAKRICPNGPGGPGDKTPPPKYPPN